jgi:hypothetical protein
MYVDVSKIIENMVRIDHEYRIRRARDENERVMQIAREFDMQRAAAKRDQRIRVIRNQPRNRHVWKGKP